MVEISKKETVINKNKSNIMKTNRKTSFNSTQREGTGNLEKFGIVKNKQSVTKTQKFEESKIDSTPMQTNEKNNLIASSMETVV